jgi:hypothetical protein
VPFLTLGSLFATSIGNPINMNSLTTWPNPTGLQLALAQCNRPSASPTQNFRQSFSPVHASDHPPLPQCKTPRLRQGSAKRSASLHLSQVSKCLARPSRAMRRYDLGFLWGLWLPVAVQNIVRNSPQRMPSAERSFIPSCPTPAAGAVS